MGLVLWLLAPLLLGPAIHAAGFLPEPVGVPLWRALGGLVLLVGLGGFVYTGLCGLMRVGEIHDF